MSATIITHPLVSEITGFFRKLRKLYLKYPIAVTPDWYQILEFTCDELKMVDEGRIPVPAEDWGDF